MFHIIVLVIINFYFLQLRELKKQNHVVELLKWNEDFIQSKDMLHCKLKKTQKLSKL